MISFVKDTQATESLLELLDNTVYGIEGGTRYSHTAVRKKIPTLDNPFYFSLQANEKILGNVNLAQRTFKNGDSAYYIRYFSFREGMKSNPEKHRKNKPKGKIQEFVESIFSPGHINTQETKALFYAYVESENERSYRVPLEYGFAPFRRMSTTVFSRFFPKISPQVDVLKEQDREYVQSCIQSFYNEYTMYHEQKLFKTGQYFTLKKEGKIIAGVQATAQKWIIHELPGISGKLMFTLVPYIPILNKVFNPKNYTFLSFDYFFCLPGFEESTNELIEGVLAYTGHHSGIFWTDENAPLYNLLHNKVRLGFMNKMKKNVPADILLKMVGFDSGEIKFYKQNPAFICSFDLT